VRAGLAALAVLSLVACGGPQDAFVGDRLSIACTASLPVCTATAGCVLDDSNYAASTFQQGGTTRAIVRLTGPADVEVALFFQTEQSPGTDTEIAWYETGCRQRFSDQSGGKDVFVEAGDARVYTRTQRLNLPGDHLIEVFSDAQAQVLVKVSVHSAQ
jgi:hypothetical protein